MRGGSEKEKKKKASSSSLSCLSNSLLPAFFLSATTFLSQARTPTPPCFYSTDSEELTTVLAHCSLSKPCREQGVGEGGNVDVVSENFEAEV